MRRWTSRLSAPLCLWLMLPLGCRSALVEPDGPIDLLTDPRGLDAAPVDAAVVDARPDLATSCAPPSVPRSGLQVIVDVRNDAMTDRFVVTQSCYVDGFCGPMGQRSGDCMVYGVSGASGEVDLAVSFQVVCEGPPPPTRDPGGYHRVKPGETFRLGYWNGNQVHTCTAQVDCATRGWPQGGIVNETRSWQTPAPVGDYKVSVPFESVAPSGCAGGPDDYLCYGSGFGFGNGGVTPICKGTHSATAPLTLPSTGTVTVTIPLL